MELLVRVVEIRVAQGNMASGREQADGVRRMKCLLLAVFLGADDVWHATLFMGQQFVMRVEKSWLECDE